MDRQKLLTELTAIFQEVLDEEALDLSENSTAQEVEAWDSLTHVQIVVAIEKQYGIKFSAREIPNFRNLGEMMDALIARL